MDIPGNELAIAPHPALHVDKVIRVANGADTLGDLLTLPGEAVVFLTSRFYVLSYLFQIRCRFCRTAWTTLCRLASGGMEPLLDLAEHVFRLHDDLCGSSQFGSHGR